MKAEEAVQQTQIRWQQRWEIKTGAVVQQRKSGCWQQQRWAIKAEEAANRGDFCGVGATEEAEVAAAADD